MRERGSPPGTWEPPRNVGAPQERATPPECMPGRWGGPRGVPLSRPRLPIPPGRLRSVKMEQRKLNDQANTLVDLAKVSPAWAGGGGCWRGGHGVGGARC